MKYRLIIVIFILFTGVSIAMIWHTDQLRRHAIEKSGLNTAKIYTDAISAFRTLYTSEVVAVAEKKGWPVSHDYVESGALPLPATLSILLGEKLAEKGAGAGVRLYSPYPFPWRMNQLDLFDDFSTTAWESISQGASQAFYRFYWGENNVFLRYAVADQMRESCVNCHNNHPRTPKSDWQVGDIRGILEVTVPLNEVVASTHKDLQLTVIIYALLSILGLLGLVYMLRKHHREIESLKGILTVCSYCHKIKGDSDEWLQIEKYVAEHSQAQFSHGVCPGCLDEARKNI